MSEKRSHFRLHVLLLGAVALLLPAVMRGSQTTLTIGNMEQGGSGPRWDTGSLTVTINGHSETVGFGQFSTPQSVASGLAAKFSLDCKSPVVAKASGAVITFITKNPGDPFYEVSSAPVWDSADFATSSFYVLPTSQPTGGTVTAMLNVVCDPDPVPAGGSADCTAQLPANATGTVTFAIQGQPVWSTANVDAEGYAPATTLTNLQGGSSYTVQASYSGNSQYSATQQTVPLTVLNGTLATSQVYSYSISSQLQGQGTPGYTADGNIGVYTEQVNGQSLTHNMLYDSLDRLTQAVVQPTGGSPTASLCWSYDSFGNRTMQSPTQLQSGACPNVGAGSVAAVFGDGTNHVAGMSYDNAGNITYDGTNYYLYDGNQRLCAVGIYLQMVSTSTMTVYQYIYDADGNRVAKRVNASYPAGQPMTCDPNASGFAVTNAYIVDEDGNQVTEMVVANGQASWAHTNVFAGGKVLATYDTVGLHFHVTDWLGTKRVQTNSSGQVEEACLNSPFGDNQNCAFTANSTTADDATEHHFTNQMRDPESGGAYPQSGLDYFPARYYNSSTGRFMSADYSEGPDTIPFANLSDPQTFNLYAYAGNNPLSAIDPSGHDTDNGCTTEQDFSGGDCDEPPPPPPPPPSPPGGNIFGAIGNFFEGVGGGILTGLSYAGDFLSSLGSALWSGLGGSGGDYGSSFGMGFAGGGAASKNPNIALLGRLIFSEATPIADPANQQKEMAAVAFTALNRVSYLNAHRKMSARFFGATTKTLSGVIHASHPVQYGSVGGPQWNLAGDPDKLNRINAAFFALSNSVAADIFAGTIPDPFAAQGGTYGMFQAGHNAHLGSGFFVLDSQIPGSNNIFYGLDP